MIGLATAPAVHTSVRDGTVSPVDSRTVVSVTSSTEVPRLTSTPRRAQQAQGGLSELFAQLRHDLRRDVDQHPAQVARPQVREPAQRPQADQLQRRRGLGPGVSAADHHEGAPFDPLGLGAGRIGQFQLGQDVIAQVDRLGQHLHPAGVALQPGDVEGAGHIARGEHQQVVALDARLAGDGAHHAGPGVQVQSDHRAGHQPRAVQGAAQGGHRAGRGEQPGGHLGQQGTVDQVVAWRDRARPRPRAAPASARGASRSGIRRILRRR